MPGYIVLQLYTSTRATDSSVRMIEASQSHRSSSYSY
jgi:hypothetical protein